MGIYQKPLSVTAIGLKNCPLSKLVLGQVVLDQSKPVDSCSHQIFANAEFPSKWKRHATPFGAGYTEYQPEIMFLDSFRGKNQWNGPYNMHWTVSRSEKALVCENNVVWNFGPGTNVQGILFRKSADEIL